MCLLSLLKRSEGTDVTDKHTKQKILEILALRGEDDAVNLLLQRLRAPLGNLR